MTFLLARVLTTLHLEDNNLVTLYQWVHNFNYYFGSFYSRGTNCDSTLIVYEEHLVNYKNGFFRKADDIYRHFSEPQRTKSVAKLLLFYELVCVCM